MCAAPNLDSVDTVTDGSGTIVHQQAFSLFGVRYNTDWQEPDGDPVSQIDPYTSRGFTSHEHTAAFGPIHMNRRVYDPEVGRFLSADPFIQSPHNSQSYNRYSYVLNNPLKYVNPSGNFWKLVRNSISRNWNCFTRTVSQFVWTRTRTTRDAQDIPRQYWRSSLSNTNATNLKISSGSLIVINAQKEWLTHDYEFETEICSRSGSACIVDNVWGVVKDNSVLFQDGGLTDGAVSSIPGIGTVETCVDDAS